jgi:hypothetical protein
MYLINNVAVTLILYGKIIIKAMDHFREIKNNLVWHKEGKFEVELVNGIIKKLNFCEPGAGPEGTGKCLTSTDYKFLKSVYSCLGELFTFIDEENKRLGYRYAREIEDMPQYQESETKLRPLINYDHQSESIENELKNIGGIELTA